MHIQSIHMQKSSPRRLQATVLTVIYMLIVLYPLAPLAMNSKVVAHAVTGECVGDCRICGCSPEARANHTCCCAKKKQMQNGVEKHPSIAKKSCCAASKPVEPIVAKNDCCAKTMQHQQDAIVQDSQHNDEQSNSGTTVLKCGCPCGKGKQLALAGFGSNELLPITINERMETSHVATLFAGLSKRLASRHGEPPDPPPRLSQIS